MISPTSADNFSADPPKFTPAWRSRKWRAFTAIAITYITVVFASAFAFLALPKIADDFDVTLAAVGWVVIIESLLIAALLLPLGGLADVLGDKRVLSIGVVIFGVGTLLTGVSPTFATLIGARIVMALGNALVQSVATGLLVAVFPGHERGLAMGAQTAAVAVGSASAPLVGGLALETFSWNAVFVLLVVPTLISLGATIALIPGNQLREIDSSRTFDLSGSVLSALAIAAVVVTIGNPFALGWTSPGIFVGGIAALSLVAFFIRRELGVDHPMLELRLFAVPVFRTSVALRTLGFLAAAPTTLLFPVYLLSYRQVSAATAGVLIAIVAVGLGVGAQISGRMYDRIGPQAPTLLGFVLQTVVGISFALSSGTTSLVLLGLVGGLGGLGMGLWNVPNNSAMLGATPPAYLGVGGAFTNVTRTLGTVLGQALSAAVVSSVMSSRGFDIPLGELADVPGAGSAFNDGWSVAYLFTAGLSSALIVLATRLPNATTNGRR